MLTSLFFSNLKHITWNYENEFRCTTASNAKGMPYIDGKPKEIYIGMNCSPVHEERLQKIAQAQNIPIYKMEFDDLNEHYDLIPKLLQ